MSFFHLFPQIFCEIQIKTDWTRNIQIDVWQKIFLFATTICCMICTLKTQMAPRFIKPRMETFSSFELDCIQMLRLSTL
jgi:hypothetical protein